MKMMLLGQTDIFGYWMQWCIPREKCVFMKANKIERNLSTLRITFKNIQMQFWFSKSFQIIHVSRMRVIRSLTRFWLKIRFYFFHFFFFGCKWLIKWSYLFQDETNHEWALYFWYLQKCSISDDIQLNYYSMITKIKNLVTKCKLWTNLSEKINTTFRYFS